MRFIKRFVSGVVLSILVLSVCPAAFAQTYRVEELNFSIELPDTWQAATRTEADEDFIQGTYQKNQKEWESFMKLYDYYLFAAVKGKESKQYEILVSSYDDFNEEIDYNESFTFELEMTAKASFKANENGDSTTVYSDYGVVEGDETKYIVFNYRDTDKDGNPVYGKLYHTVMNGHAIDFDLNAYEKLSDDYVRVFDEAVLSVKYDKIEKEAGAWYELSGRVKMNLTYIALGVLAIALIAVIIIFILSKIKEKKQFERAAEEAQKASEMQENSEQDITEDKSDAEE